MEIVDSFCDDPREILEGLISDPIFFETEDGGAFVDFAIDSALDKLSPREARDYVSRLNKVGYNVSWRESIRIDYSD